MNSIKTAKGLEVVRGITIDDVLELLMDGKWHSFEELREQLQLKNGTLESMVSFLSEYGFVKLDEKKMKVRIDEDIKQLNL